MSSDETLLYSRDKVKKYLVDIHGFNPTSVEIGGCQRFDKGLECVFLNGTDFISITVIQNIIKKTGDDIFSFQKTIALILD